MHADNFVMIVALMQDYFDGLYHSDASRLTKVFHPRALYATAAEPVPLIRTMEEYLPIVAARQSPAVRGEQRSDRILSIDMVGPETALVKVACSIQPRRFIDLLSLIRVEGQWRIIAKVFHSEMEKVAS